MKRIIPILFALGLWLSLTPQAWGQERNEQGISFIYKGIESPKKFFQPEGQPPQTRADEMFDLTGCWSCLSEVGSAGGGMSLNTHLPEGYLLIWFNADGTYYQQLGSGGSILVYRRWWNLGGLSFGDSDGFVMQTMSYADGVLTYRGSNIDNPEYSTTVVLKRYNKISLNIGAGTGYLGVKVDKLLKGAAADGETKLRIDVKSITSDYASYRIELSTEYGEDEDLCGMAGELRRTGQTTDLKESAYTFFASSAEDDPQRFSLAFRLSETTETPWKVYLHDHVLYVLGLEGGERIYLYDMSGHCLLGTTGTAPQFATPVDGSGLYIVDIVSSKARRSFKVIAD